MPLANGAKLGPYEIVTPLGSCGMGEVYRARDTRLDRTVAIKVLPQHLMKALASGETSPMNKVTFIFHFFDELRQKVPTGKN